MLKKVLAQGTILLLASACAQMESSNPKVSIFNLNPNQELHLTQSDLADRVQAAIKTGEQAKEYLASDLFIKGNDAAIRGDYKTAITLFKYVVQLVPQDMFVQKKLAVELIRMGELKEAEGLLTKVFNESKGKDESVGLILAGVYAATDKNAYAKDVYKKLIKDHNSEEACLYLAKYFAGEKQFNEAHSTLSQCAKKNKDEPSFAYFRGKIDFERGIVDSAKKYFNEALRIDPTYAQAAVALGSIYEDKEDFNQAVTTYKKFLNADEANGFNILVLSKLVNVYLQQEKNEEVLPYLETLTALETEDLNLKVRLGLIYSEVAKYDAALKQFKDVLEMVPESDKILYYIGALHQQMNNPKDAVEAYKKILPTSPLFSDASVQIGQIYSSKAREDFSIGKADNISIFQDFVEERVKNHPEVGLELKMIQAGFFEDTFRYHLAVDALSPYKAQENFTDSHVYYYSSLLERVGNYVESRAMIQKLLDKDPNNAHALNFIGYSWLERNENLDKAFEYISKAVKLKPEDGYIRDSLAWYFYTVGKYPEALKEAKKAFELIRSDVTITKHLAKIYETMKNFDKAREVYAEALKNAKEQSEREDVLKLINNLDKVRLPASQAN